MENKEIVVSKQEAEKQSKANQLLNLTKELVINNSADYEQAVSVAAAIRQLYKAAEDERKAIVKPFKDGIKAIEGRINLNILSPLQQAKIELDQKMLAFSKAERERQEKAARAEAERLRLEAQAKAEQLRQANMEVMATAVINASEVEAKKAEEIKPTAVSGAIGGKAYVRTTYFFSVKDFNLLPDKYKLINEAALRQAVSEGIKEIPGCTLETKETLVAGK